MQLFFISLAVTWRQIRARMRLNSRQRGNGTDGHTLISGFFCGVRMTRSTSGISSAFVRHSCSRKYRGWGLLFGGGGKWYVRDRPTAGNSDHNVYDGAEGK